MNKQDVVAAVARSSGISKASADDAVDAIFSAITDALKNGEDVRLVGFGTFSTRRRAARQGRSPATGRPDAPGWESTRASPCRRAGRRRRPEPLVSRGDFPHRIYTVAAPGPATAPMDGRSAFTGIDKRP